MTCLKVGTTVRTNRCSPHCLGIKHNPDHTALGTVTGAPQGGDWYFVEWETGGENWYTRNDLVEVVIHDVQ